MPDPKVIRLPVDSLIALAQKVQRAWPAEQLRPVWSEARKKARETDQEALWQKVKS